MARTVNPYTDHYAPVGAIVWCSYWHYAYEVLSVIDGEITCRKLSRPEAVAYGADPNRLSSQWDNDAGKVWSHRTTIDKRDVILFDPTDADIRLNEVL